MKFTKTLLFAAVLGMYCQSCGKTNASSTETEDNSNITDQVMTQNDSNNVRVDIESHYGRIQVMLYNDTPKHRDNFIKLVKEGYYNGTLFHRVINEFMVQAGDPESKNAPAGKQLGGGDPGYTIEAEFVYPKHFHKKGALAAAAPVTRLILNAVLQAHSFTS